MADENRGHVYRLKNVEEGEQELRFIRKIPSTVDGDDTLLTAQDGTTNEAVIEALIDRITFLDNKMPSDFNKRAIQGLTDARTALEERTADRESREVEGTDKP